MDERRRVCHRVLVEGVSLSAAAREAGVCRATARLWVGRARESGVAGFCELSRRPLCSPRAFEGPEAGELLAARAARPYWGAKKLLVWLWPGKGPRRYEALSVLDDATRYCVALAVVPAMTAEAAFAALWEAFGAHGLPERLLTDNGACFTATSSHRAGALEPRLWRLGVATSHGRPALRQPTAEKAREVLAAYRTAYNWERPHEAIGMAVPGALYRPSPRTRPEREPAHEPPEGATLRKVDKSGKFRFQGDWHRAGHGLAGETLETRETPTGKAAFYASFLVDHLDAMRVVRMCCHELRRMS